MTNFIDLDYKLKKSDHCLCGSGLRFSQCCYNYINSDESDVERHMQNREFEKAFKTLNGQLTNYLTKVIRHTKRFLLDCNNEAANILLKIDIDAVDETVTRLIRIANDSKLNVDFEKRLQFVGNILDVKPWKQRLLFLAILYYDIIGESAVCKRLLRNVNHENVVDINLLEIYYQIMSDNMGIGEIEALLKKIVSLEQKKIMKLKYRFSLALHYLFYLDENTAKNMAKDIMQELSDIENSSEPYERSIIADMHSFYGEMMDDEVFILKAIDELINLSEDSVFISSRISQFMIDIGRLYMLIGKYSLSLEYLEKSKATFYYSLADIYIGDVYIRQQNKDKACDVLYNISVSNLHNKIDYLLTITRLLILWPDNTKARQIITELKGLDKGITPYFTIALRDSLCQLYESTEYLSNFENEQKDKVLDTLNQAVMLQPNFCGIGLNINALIDRLLKQKKR